MSIKSIGITVAAVAVGLFIISRTGAAPYFGLTQQKGL